MSDKITRIYVEKKKVYAVEAAGLCSDLQQTRPEVNLKSVRIVNRYDLEGLSEEDARLLNLVPQRSASGCSPGRRTEIPAGVRACRGTLPGQYDQREDLPPASASS